MRVLLQVFLIGVLLLPSALLPVSQAQITLDGSLGPQGAPPGPHYVIPAEVGQMRGANLFHSFGQFNVRTGDSVTFAGPSTIDNILGRVTGGHPSWVDGRLQSEIPGANLFLLNPSGVLFGPNASLDIDGSFHVSTADVLRFADGTTFAANPVAGGVLSMAPPMAFGFLREHPAAISIRGSKLHVSEGATLSVVGGDIEMTGASVKAPNGRIHIVSVASPGDVMPDALGEAPGLRVDAFERLGEVMFSQHTLLDASGEGGGTVAIRGGRLMIDNANILAVTEADVQGAPIGIDVEVTGEAVFTNGALVATAASGAGDAGTIRVRANRVEVSNGAIFSGVTSGSSADAGDISITAGRLEVTRGGRVENITSGTGHAGHITITTSEAAGQLILGDGGRIGTFTEDVGHAGDISITVGRLEVTGSGAVESSTSGTGHAGDITVTASEAVTLFGSGDFGTLLSTNTFRGAGDAGNIYVSAPTVKLDGGIINTDTVDSRGAAGVVVVEAGRLHLTGGALISSNAFGAGQGGTVIVKATEAITVAGASEVASSSIQSIASNGGSAGEVTVSTPSLRLDAGGAIRTASFLGGRRGGDISIEVGMLTLTEGGQISSEASIASTGAGGNVTVTATEAIFLSNTSSDPAVRSSIASGTFGPGNGGTITITTPALLSDNGFIEAQTFGSGRAGDLTLAVGSLTLTNGGGINADASDSSSGQGGNITITATDTIFLSGRSRTTPGLQSGISGDTAGTGDGGRLFLSAPTIMLDDGFIGALTAGGGDAGNVRIEAERLILTNGAQVNTNSLGSGNAGDITVVAQEHITVSDHDSEGGASRLLSFTLGSGNAGRVSLAAPTLELEGGRISTATRGEGQAGEIAVQVGRLALKGGAQIDSSSESSGQGGRVTVKAAETIVLSGQNSTILTNAEDRGQGGDISLQARHIQLTAGASISSQSSGTGNAGTIRLAASDTFLSENSAVTAEARRAQGGAIQVMAQTMIRLRQSEITTTVRGGDEMAGSITLDPAFIILEDSQIRADAVGGPGGNITITTEVFLTDPSSIVSASSERNIDGEIDIRAPVADLSGTVAPLPQSFLQQAVLLRERCAERLRRGWTSSFIVSGRDGSPFEPGSMLSSPLSRESQGGTGGLRSTTTPLPESSRCGP